MQANDELKEEVMKASGANGRLMMARITERLNFASINKGPEMVNSWECLPGSNEEVFVQTVIVRDHMGLPFVGRAYLRPHELRCFNFEAGFLIAAGKAYRQMADDITRRGLAKVRTLFGPYEAARKRHGDLIDMGMKALDQVSRRSPLTHEERLLDALLHGRVIICDQCHKPYGSYEKLISTAKGNLFQCPHCKNIVPKCTLGELHKSAKVMPEDDVYNRVRKRLQGTLMWTEHKDGTITEDLVEEEVIQGLTAEEAAAVDLGGDATRDNVAAHMIAEAICPKPSPAVAAYGAMVGALAPQDLPFLPEEDVPRPVFTSAMGKCSVCDQVDRVGLLKTEATACLEGFELMLCVGHADLFLEYWDMGMNEEGAMAAIKMVYDGIADKETAFELVAEHGPDEAYNMAVGIKPSPEPVHDLGEPVGGKRVAVKSPMLTDEDKEYLQEALDEEPAEVDEPKPNLVVTLGKITTDCIRCGKNHERAPDDPSSICPECKEGGWYGMGDGQMHRLRYWKDPLEVQWQAYQSLCEKYQGRHPSDAFVLDKDMNYEEETICTICYEKHKGAK